MQYVGELFADEPDFWKMRGDPLLWAELGKTLAETPLPENVETLERLLETSFWDATGYSLSFANQVLVDRLAEVGRTRGGISGADWRYRLFPAVIRAYKQARETATT